MNRGFYRLANKNQSNKWDDIKESMITDVLLSSPGIFIPGDFSNLLPLPITPALIRSSDILLGPQRDHRIHHGRPDRLVAHIQPGNQHR